MDVWILYWRNVKDGIGPLGIIAVFDSQKEAYQFLFSSMSYAYPDRPLFSEEQRERIGVCKAPKR